ncbi:MAG: hypothetical protein AB7I27_12180 [Bacteriovoracaceae bacterium]
MFNYWPDSKKYLSFSQGVLLAWLFLANSALARRMPASYVPDDDVIAKPVDNEISLYQKYIASDNSSDVVNTRNQLKVWHDNQVFAQQYHLDSSMQGSPYFVPTQEQKWEYFKNKYFRYMKARGEQPIKDMPKNWYQDYRASNEVDTIDEIEGRFKSSQKKSSSSDDTSSAPAIPGMQAKEVNLWKKTRVIFQPRIDMGILVFGIKNNDTNTYARSWIGVNGRTEMNIQQGFDSIGLRIMYNYFTDTGRYFTSVDKQLVENVYARFTSNKDPKHSPGSPYQDDTLMLLYARQF